MLIKGIYKKTSRLSCMENEFSAKVIQQKFLSIFSKQLITRDFEFLTDYNKVSVKVVKAYHCRLQLRLRNKNRRHLIFFASALNCTRLQNSPCFCVFIYARTVKQKVWNEAENRERGWGETPHILTPRFTDFFTDFEKKNDYFAV